MTAMSSERLGMCSVRGSAREVNSRGSVPFYATRQDLFCGSGQEVLARGQVRAVQIK